MLICFVNARFVPRSRRTRDSSCALRLGDVGASIEGFADFAAIKCSEHLTVAIPRFGHRAALPLHTFGPLWENWLRDEVLMNARHVCLSPGRITLALFLERKS